MHGETLVATESQHHVGGKGFNQAVALARLGCDVTFVGGIGQDMLGSVFKNFAQAEGVNFVPDVRTGRSTGLAVPIVTPDGVSSIIVDARTAQDVSSTHLRQILSTSNWDALSCHYEFPHEGLDLLLDFFRDVRAPVFLNPAPWTGERPLELARRARTVLLNEVEGKALLADAGLTMKAGAPLTDLAIRCSQVCRTETLVLTLGKEGSIAVSGDDTIHCSAVPVKVLDSTGAGDAFCAAFVFGRLAAWSMRKTLAFASGMASGACSRKGGADSMPALDEALHLAQLHEFW
jgi:ribokinase